MMQRLTPQLDDGEILASRIGPTYTYSLTKNRHHNVWKSAKLFELALRRVFTSVKSEDRLVTRTADQPLYRLPRNLPMCVYFVRLICRWPSKVLHEIFFPDHWFLLWNRSNSSGRQMNEFQEIPSPSDGQLADPCAVEWGEKIVVFVEHYVRARKRGQISIVEIPPLGQPSAPKCVLREEWHLSNPFVFEWNSHWWLIPESSSTRRVSLYVAENFPYNWKHQAVLIDGVNACDATLAEIDSKWWMWVSVTSENQDAWDEVNLYIADTPLGPWVEHPMNPVCQDVHCSRPAGRVFFENGYWIRPAQDCSNSYGGGLRFQRIVKLNETSYREVYAGEIQPDWRDDICGIHAWTRVRDVTLVDAKRKKLGFQPYLP